MRDQWIDRLSEYLDDELGPAERAAAEAHLAECAECRGVLVELAGVVARAGAIEDRPPPRDLWYGIAAQIGTRRDPVVRRLGGSAARRLVFSVPQLAAAAVLLVVIGGAGGWLMAPATGGGGVAAPSVPVAAAVSGDVRNVATDASGQVVTAAVEQLEAVLEAGRGGGSPSTVLTLETNLAIIDSAIADARRAVAGDPGNAYLQTHLADVMRRKLTLLQHAASLTSAAS